MFYGCRFKVTDDYVVLNPDYVTSGQRGYEEAKEALYAYVSCVEENSNPNIGFAVIFNDGYDSEVYYFMLDDKFLNEQSIDEIASSLQMKYKPLAAEG